MNEIWVFIDAHIGFALVQYELPKPSTPSNFGFNYEETLAFCRHLGFF
jgi:hypothetical protein